MRIAILIIMLAAFSVAGAEPANTERHSVTLSYSASDKTEKNLDTLELDSMSPLKKFGFREETSHLSTRSLLDSRYLSDVSVYDARTILLSDYDHNGFYHRFKVIIDVDTAAVADLWVYARLYLSLEGGPWNHYATSADFRVSGSTDADEFAVETELVDGYPTGYYDIKIELFDADGHWLLDYDSYDDSSLNAVPLEDRERDDYYAYISAGSTQAGFLFLMAALVLIRAGYQTPALRALLPAGLSRASR